MDTEVEETQLSETVPSPVSSDVTPPSSAANNPPDADSGKSSDPQGAVEPGSLSEALSQVKLEEPAEETAGDKGTPAEGSPTSENAESVEADADGAEVAKDATTAAKGVAEDSADAPFSTRPEWAEAIKLGGKAIKPLIREMLGRETRLNERLRELKPHIEAVDELKRYTGDEQGFNQMRNIVRAYSTDPAASVPVLEHMLADARQRAGFEISSADLKGQLTEIEQQVSDGIIDETQGQRLRATLLETEKARAGQRRAESRVMDAETQRQQQEQQAAERRDMAAINAWEDSKRKLDIDFGDVTPVADPRHGESVADRVFDAMCIARAANPQATVTDLIKAADRAYSIASQQRRPSALRQSRVITSTSSASVTAKPKPKSVREAMDQVKLS